MKTVFSAPGTGSKRSGRSVGLGLVNSTDKKKKKAESNPEAPLHREDTVF